jgi:hypothetical protein
VIYHYRLTSGSMSVTFTESHMQDEMRWPLLVRENLGHEYLDAYVHTLVRSTKNRMRILKYAAAYHDRDFVEGLIAQARSLWDGIPLARLYAEDLAPLSPYLKGELFPLLALLITGSDGDFFDFLTGTRRAVPAWVDGGVL